MVVVVDDDVAVASVRRETLDGVKKLGARIRRLARAAGRKDIVVMVEEGGGELGDEMSGTFKLG